MSTAAFLVYFFSFWNTYPLTERIPAHGDAVEVIWGILWYNQALTGGTNPFDYPFLFHPIGWQVGTLAHTPIFFMIGQPFYWIGGEAFAYNMLAILPFIISFAGAHAFAKRMTSNHLIVVAIALAYTFIPFRSERVGGHLHILWASGMLPWLGAAVLAWRQNDDNSRFWHKEPVRCGLVWGGMISVSLYSIFLGPIVFLLLGKKLLSFRRIGQLIAVGLIAAVVGSVSILPYVLGSSAQTTLPPSIVALNQFSSNLNSVFVPGFSTLVPTIREWTHPLIPTVENEAGGMNLGVTSLVILLIGLFYPKRVSSDRLGLALLFAVGFVLALGPFLKWSNQTIDIPFLSGINTGLYRLGALLKPELFSEDRVPAMFAEVVPLPSYLLLIFVPFWEGARVAGRFIFGSMLGAFGLIGLGLEALPRWLSVILIAIWLIELYPGSTASKLIDPIDLHPAYAYVQAQPLRAGHGVVDINNRLEHSGHMLYTGLLSGIPTASSAGSFVPLPYPVIRDSINQIYETSAPELWRTLNAFDVQFLLIHGGDDGILNQTIIDTVATHPQLFGPPVCIEPTNVESLWPDPICVIEVFNHETLDNVLPLFGFSDEEAWGMWGIDPKPRFNFVGFESVPYRVTFEAFPHCVEGRSQTMSMIFREEVVYSTEWSSCDSIRGEVILPADQIEIGLNEVRLELEYALSPAELGTGSDTRPLSVGFSRLEVEPVAP